MKNKKLFYLTECAIMIALATVLSLIKVYQAPLGGSVTLLATLPIVFVSFRHGLGWGLLSGFVYSVIQLLLGLGNIAYIPSAFGVVGCILLDYIVPYTLLGLAGITEKFKPKTTATRIAAIVSGTAFVMVLRFLCHFICGAVVWYSITKEGAWNDEVFKYGMWMYSFIYNISYIGPDALLAILASPVMERLKSLPFAGKRTID